MSSALLSASDNGKNEMSPWLAVWKTDAPGRARRVVLPFDGPFLVGTIAQCDLVVEDDKWVSRRHLNFACHGGFAGFRDLGSKNGTWLNHQPCAKSELYDGDVLRVGDTCMQLYYPVVGEQTPQRDFPPARRVDERWDPARAAVVRIDARFQGRLSPFKRGELDKMFASELDIGPRQARRLLDSFAVDCLKVPRSVHGSDRWQSVADICTGRRP